MAATEDLGTTVTTVPAGLAQELGTGLISGLTIIASGRTVFRWPDSPAGQHLLMSVSKVFTSLAIGLLADHGELDYDDSVREHLSGLGSQLESCLVLHVLDMTSADQAGPDRATSTPPSIHSCWHGSSNGSPDSPTPKRFNT
jgi:hypothetical protein